MPNRPNSPHAVARPLTVIVFVALLTVAAVPMFGVAAGPLRVATAPSLGAATSFSVLAALSMSAAGAGTTISGDLGLSPGLAVSRTGPWTVGGSEYFGTGGLSEDAQADALIAFNNLALQLTDGPWSTDPWSPAPGVWTEASDTTFAGTITLSGDYDDVWVFQVGRDMTFSGSVVMAGNAQPCNVFWQIGRDATIASGSAFIGTLIASRDIFLVSGATVDGRLISLNSSLTTDGNTITGPICVAAQPTDTVEPVATDTTEPVATDTTEPVATDTSVPVATNTSVPAPAATNTSVPAATVTPIPVPTATVVVVGLPSTGGAPPSSADLLWIAVLAASIVGVLAAGLGVRSHRAKQIKR